MTRRSPQDVARTRAFWLANKPTETAAPAYVIEPPSGWVVAGALALALALQTALAPFLAVRGGTVSFVLLVVAWFGVRTGSVRGLAFGLLAGACEDALAGTTGVAWTFATGVAGALAGRLAGTWLSDTKLILVPGAAVLTIVRFALFTVILQGEGRPLTLPVDHVVALAWQALLDAAVALLLLWLRPQLVTRANRR
ncbi:MAG: hypothetical protein GIX03_14150 [Candidatus Eremiobacteraeota bacterium]|nr:hypothetical protein [Candidatus Eremiobacteraeota bacterium]MBC5804110.1 hypothetical protein [Candidatus Eremiobacteraeota bacterium]MBC5820762.1 hypothetical protein [Candidatus Eremiobacteraeota bacterium]